MKLEHEKYEKKFHFEFENNSTLTEIFDVLCDMSNFILQEMHKVMEKRQEVLKPAEEEKACCESECTPCEKGPE